MLGLGNSIGGPDVFRDLNDVPDLQLWLKNGVGVAVDQWDDSSRKGRHIKQGTSGNQAGLLNGGLDFEEGNLDHYDFLPQIEIAQNQGFCVSWVLDAGTTTNNTILSDTSNEVIQIQNSNKLRINTNDDSNIETKLHVGSAFGAAKMQILINRTGAGVWTVYKDAVELTIEADSGGSINSDDGENVNGFTLDTVGAKAAAANHYLDGILFELAFWDRALTAGEMVEVSTYLKDKHSL
jgi:hypothetical protein